MSVAADIPLDEFLAKLSPEIAGLARRLHALAKKAAPRATVKAYPGWRVISFSLDGGMRTAFVGIAPAKKGANVYFFHDAGTLKGSALLLRGAGKLERLTLAPGDKIPAAPLTTLIRQAAKRAAERLAAPAPNPRAKEKHKRAGGYEISASRTLPVPIATLSAAVIPDGARSKWLPKPPMTIRKATPEKSMRITWHEPPSNVDLYLYRAGDGKCRIVIQHGRLPDAKSVTQLKEYWGAALDRLTARFD